MGVVHGEKHDAGRHEAEQRGSCRLAAPTLSAAQYKETLWGELGLHT